MSITDVKSELLHIADDVEDRVKIRYKIHDINSGIANAWRRIMESERPYTRLTVHEKIEHTDRFIQKYAEHVVKRFQQIPCTNIPVGSKLKPITLDVENKTDHKIVIRTNDLVNPNPDFKISKDMAIIDLEPSAKIKLSLIPEWGCGSESQYWRSGIQMFYAALDEKSRGWADRETDRPPTGTYNPTNYELGFTADVSKGDAFDLVYGGWVVLKEKLTKVLKGLTTKDHNIVKIVSDVQSTEALSAGSSSSLTRSQKFIFIGESDTISQLLYRAAFDIDPNVEWMSPGKNHYDDADAIIRIRRTEASELMIAACNASIAKVDKILAAVKAKKADFDKYQVRTAKKKLISGGEEDVSIVQSVLETNPTLNVPAIETTVYRTPATYHFDAYNFASSTSSATSQVAS